MNIYSLSNLIHFTTDRPLSTFLNALTPLQKKVMVVATIIFAAFAAICLLAYCWDDIEAVDLSTDPEKTDDDLFIESLVKKIHEPIKETKDESNIDDTILDLTEVPEISLLLEDPLLVAEQMEVEEIRQNYLADPEAECKRFLASKILDADLIFEMAVQLINGQRIHSPVYDTASMVIGRAREFKEQFGRTNFIFTHGQSLELSFINDTMHQFQRFFESYNPLATPFRVRGKVPYTPNTEAFFRKYNVDNPSYQDNHHNLEILSVDAYFWNFDAAESALRHFLWSYNQNQIKDQNQTLNLFKSVISWYVKDPFIVDILAEKARQIALKKKKEDTLGVLYTILIPKTVVASSSNFTYRSHPYGIRCRCYKESDMELLERMQNDQPVVCHRKYVAGDGKINAQYRILTARLSEEKSARTYAFTALSAEKVQSYSKQAEKLVREARFYARLLKLKEMLPESQVDPIIEEMNLLAKEGSLDATCIRHLLDKKGSYLPERLKEALTLLAT